MYWVGQSCGQFNFWEQIKERMSEEIDNVILNNDVG